MEFKHDKDQSHQNIKLRNVCRVWVCENKEKLYLLLLERIFS